MIRVARLSDVKALVDLGLELHRDSDHNRHNFKPMKVANLLAETIKNSMSVVYVAERDGEIIGGFAGGITELWYSDSLIGFDYSLFIKQGKRHGITAIRLLSAFEEWAKSKGAVEIQMGITTGINVESTSKLYRSRGFKEVGPLFCKEVI